MADDSKAAWIARVLGVQLGDTAAGGPPDDENVDVTGEKAELESLGLDLADVWQGAVEAFQTSTETVDGQITQLQAALRETDDVDLHDIADSGLNALTANTRVPLMAAIQGGGKGSPEQLRAAAPKLLKAIEAFRAQLASPQVQACDANPFGVDMDISETFSGALDQLAYAAKMATAE